MKCLKGLLSIGLASTFFAADRYAVGGDISDVSGDEGEVAQITQGAPVIKGRKTLVIANEAAFASSYTNLTADVLKEVAIQTAKNKLLKIKSELDLTVWGSVEEVLFTNDPKAIIRLLDEVSSKRVGGPAIGAQRNESLQQGISSIARNLSKATLSPSKRTYLMDSDSVTAEKFEGSPDSVSGAEHIEG
ncbi:MAG: hypothetical protein WCJ92_02110 [Alphaproteobacteria bacterium]